MLCTAKKTFEAAAEAQASLIAQLKDNQPNLLQQTQAVCATDDPLDIDTSVMRGRNRHETRTVEVFEAAVTAPDSKSNPRTEKVIITKDKDKYYATRAGEPGFYELDSKAVDDLQKAAAAVKPATKAPAKK